MTDQKLNKGERWVSRRVNQITADDEYNKMTRNLGWWLPPVTNGHTVYRYDY